MRRLREALRPLLFTPSFGLPCRKRGDTVPRPFWGFVRGAVGGPNIRTGRMIQAFGNFPFSPNVVYAQSGWNSAALAAAGSYRQRTGLPLVFNQNGWYFPAWFGGDAEAANGRLAAVQAVADHVIYQSRFCLEAGRRLTGFVPASHEILHNAVPMHDVLQSPGGDGRTCWLSAVFTSDAAHILRPALQAFRILLRRHGTRLAPRLLLAGHISAETRQAEWFNACKKDLAELEAAGICQWLGRYKMGDLPGLMQRVDLALHLKYKDPCPNAVVERLHFGIPHVYSASGGTPELIGEAGLPLAVEDRWDLAIEVDAVMLADAVEAALADRRRLSEAACERSKLFSWSNYLERHKLIFERLLAV